MSLPKRMFTELCNLLQHNSSTLWGLLPRRLTKVHGPGKETQLHRTASCVGSGWGLSATAPAPSLPPESTANYTMTWGERTQRRKDGRPRMHCPSLVPGHSAAPPGWWVCAQSKCALEYLLGSIILRGLWGGWEVDLKKKISIHHSPSFHEGVVIEVQSGSKVK